MNSNDFDDPKLEEQWIGEQRANVERYFNDMEVRHGGVTSHPEWFIAPYVSIWTVESPNIPGAVGWWAISGDLPTDYLGGNDAVDARGAAGAFARRWSAVSESMRRGEAYPDIMVGNPDNQRELGDLLGRRAAILQEWFGDDEMWPE